MNKISQKTLVIAVLVSLAIGGVAGFILGIASTRLGQSFIHNLVEEERKPEVAHPKKLVRDAFELQYPSNWKIDVDDKDYDPDHMFSIESPGSAFVMFVIGPGETKPEDTLAIQIRQFEKLMGTPAIKRFETYGHLKGKGATLKGTIIGSKTTVRVFAFHEDGLTIMITEQSPDEDLKQVQDGMSLIENSFLLGTNNAKGTSQEPDAAKDQ